MPERPESGTDGQADRQSWPRRLAWAGVAAGTLALGAAAVRNGLDPLVGRAYDRAKPRIETIVGQVMGHPLELGPFRGIGLDGLRVGPSRLRAGSRDGSTVEAAAVTARLHPLASWRQRALVLDLDFEGVQVDLRRNARGRLWELGPLQPGAEPPRIAIRFRLPRQGRVRFWGFTPGGKPLEAAVRGGALLRIHERSLAFEATAEAPGHSGQAQLVGQGNWQRNHWQVDTATRAFAVAPLQILLPFQGRLGGEAAGRFQLVLDRGRASCRGELTVTGARWQPPGGGEALASPRLPVRCQDRALTLAKAPWRYGPWAGQVAGRTASDGSFRLELTARAPRSNPLAGQPLAASLRGHWQRGGVAVDQLDGRFGRSRLRAAGSVGSRLDLRGGWWLDPADLPSAERLASWLPTSLQGSLRAEGRLASPRLGVRAPAVVVPLLGRTDLDLLWQAGRLQLSQLRSDHLLATASLPLAAVAGRGLVTGELTTRLQLRGFPLQRLDGLVGSRLQGHLDADGALAGPLGRLRPDLRLRLKRPGVGPLRLEETWSGTLVGAAGSGLLRLAADAPAPAARLEARLDGRWQPRTAMLERGGGELRLEGDPQRYSWRARAFPLQGLALALGADPRLRSLQGRLAGSGSLGLRPLAFNGNVAIDRPALLGVAGRLLQARVTYAGRSYSIRGQLKPLVAGAISATVEGRWQGPFKARFEGRNLGTAFFRELLTAWDLWRGLPAPQRGRAADLGSLAIETLGRSIQEQLEVLAEARRAAAERDRLRASAPRSERLDRLGVAVDADLLLGGPSFARASVDLGARGHLWLDQTDRDRSLAQDPFVVRLRGPLRGGEGAFELAGLPLLLLNLLTPVPEGLRGSLTARGRYGLGSGDPRFSMDLSLAGAGLGSQDLLLEQGRVELRGRDLALNLALRAAGAANAVDLVGTLPLDPDRKGIELRLASRGDGLLFLTRLAGTPVRWKRGSADVQLLVRGSLREPIANGFLRLRNGECELVGQTLRGLQATVLFDTSQLLVQGFQARVGSNGTIRGEGSLGLVRPLPGEPSLAVDLRAVSFKLPRHNAQADGRLSLGGSLLAPRLGGTLAIGHGSINVQPAGLAQAAPASDQPAQPTTLPRLLEAKWDFKKPLVLLGPDVESQTALSLEQAMPRLSWLSFDGLRLSLGPDLRVVMGNLANFSTGGSLRISGRLDPSLRASGVVKLLGGRLNLFTTSFSLDPDAPNVAIFTPSLGLLPYLDIALRTRIADSLNVLGPSGVSDPASIALANTQLAAQGGFSSLSQLNLILVTVSVSGPADRIADNLKLRSSPPLPQERLVALIGGNSLAGLSGGGAGTALATVLGQSLLSPLLSTLSDAFGQRVSLALYPTYVTPRVTTQQEQQTRRVPPQLVLGSEIGYDLTDRINASLLAAPNRSDIPPQITINYKASERINLEAAVDTQGSWQGQLRVFLRF